jgi:predicted hydrocarbon binding protein
LERGNKRLNEIIPITTEDTCENLVNEKSMAEENRFRGLISASSESSEFFEFIHSNGSIVNKPGNSRVFVLGADSWANMEAALYEAFSSEASMFLEKMGRAYGASSARKLKPFVQSVSVLQKIAIGAGLGTFVITADEEAGTWIRINAQDCVFCHGFGSNHDCSFLSGIAQGMAEEFYNKQYQFIRKKCHVIGEKHTCEVVLQETYYDPIHKRRRIVELAQNPLGEEFR